jgi:hypothetical protein
MVWFPNSVWEPSNSVSRTVVNYSKQSFQLLGSQTELGNQHRLEQVIHRFALTCERETMNQLSATHSLPPQSKAGPQFLRPGHKPVHILLK